MKKKTNRNSPKNEIIEIAKTFGIMLGMLGGLKLIKSLNQE